MIETCAYRVSFRNRPVGKHLLRTQKGRRIVTLEAQLMLQGALGQHVITQISKIHASTLRSLSFTEYTQDRHETRVYQVLFDQRSGLVTAQRGKGDWASIPFIVPYQDPLGLFHELRRQHQAHWDMVRMNETSDNGVAPNGMAPEPEEYAPTSLDEGIEVKGALIPMLGKYVRIEPLGEAELTTFMGVRQASMYMLFPGRSLVYIDRAAPYYILKLIQRVRHHSLESVLMKVSSERGVLGERREGLLNESESVSARARERDDAKARDHKDTGSKERPQHRKEYKGTSKRAPSRKRRATSRPDTPYKPKSQEERSPPKNTAQNTAEEAPPPAPAPYNPAQNADKPTPTKQTGPKPKPRRTSRKSRSSRRRRSADHKN